MWDQRVDKKFRLKMDESKAVASFVVVPFFSKDLAPEVSPPVWAAIVEHQVSFFENDGSNSTYAPIRELTAKFAAELAN